MKTEWHRSATSSGIGHFEDLVHVWAKERGLDPKKYLPIAREDTDVWPVYTMPDWTRYASVIQPIVTQVLSYLNQPGGVITRLALVRLKAGANIAPHVDNHAMAAKAHRIHVSLSNTPSVTYKIGGRKFTMRMGRAYDFNNRLRHSVRNTGRQARVNLFIDYYAIQAWSSAIPSTFPRRCTKSRHRLSIEASAPCSSAGADPAPVRLRWPRIRCSLRAGVAAVQLAIPVMKCYIDAVGLKERSSVGWVGSRISGPAFAAALLTLYPAAVDALELVQGGYGTTPIEPSQTPHDQGRPRRHGCRPGHCAGIHSSRRCRLVGQARRSGGGWPAPAIRPHGSRWRHRRHRALRLGHDARCPSGQFDPGAYRADRRRCYALVRLERRRGPWSRPGARRERRPDGGHLGLWPDHGGAGLWPIRNRSRARRRRC